MQTRRALLLLGEAPIRHSHRIGNTRAGKRSRLQRQGRRLEAFATHDWPRTAQWRVVVIPLGTAATAWCRFADTRAAIGVKGVVLEIPDTPGSQANFDSRMNAQLDAPAHSVSARRSGRESADPPRGASTSTRHPFTRSSAHLSWQAVSDSDRARPRGQGRRCFT